MLVTINQRKTIHKGSVYELVSENITLDNGVTADIGFIHHPGATAIVPMLDDTHIILINQYRHALRKFIWEIPAGTLNPRETAITCARRELIEETGYSARKFKQLAEITPVPGYSDERIYIYLATDLDPAEQSLDSDEILNVHTLKFEEALNMIRNGEIQDSKTISGLILAYSWLQNSHH
jgi:ADP-ribose pyrophosphatase